MTSPALYILIAEDEISHALAMRRMLEKSLPAARVEVVESIREYQKSIDAELPTIVFMDLNLTDGCSLDMLKAASAPPPFPVIMLSSSASSRVAADAVQAGAGEFIIKSPEFFLAIADIVVKTVREWNLRQERIRAL
jgi:DNA-binding NtrC family response regulator